MQSDLHNSGRKYFGWNFVNWTRNKEIMCSHKKVLNVQSQKVLKNSETKKSCAATKKVVEEWRIQKQRNHVQSTKMGWRIQIYATCYPYSKKSWTFGNKDKIFGKIQGYQSLSWQVSIIYNLCSQNLSTKFCSWELIELFSHVV